jgi:chemotaxis protein methyltransferase CheR
LETLPGNEVTLAVDEFEQIRELALRASGIDLTKSKRALVEARLGKTIRQGRFASFHQYYDHVVADRTGESLIALLDALTTNFTAFLREPPHFEFLRKSILPRLDRPIRVWSAGCSTGEEPFSIAFSILEELGIAGVAGSAILATDISTRALATAAQATYPSDRFADLPPDWLRKYILRGSGPARGLYRVKPHVRAMVEFRRLNLIEPFGIREIFDVIFCRNVMIYFNQATQAALVNNLAGRLTPGGYLLIGHSETLAGVSTPLEYVKPAIYRRSV